MVEVLDRDITRTYVPRKQRRALVWSKHCLQHDGADKTIKNLKDNHYWPNMEKEIKTWINNCVCQKKKKNRHKPAETGQSRIIQDALEEVAIDLYEYDNAEYLTILDRWSKFKECIKVASKNSADVKAGMENIL